MSNTAIKFDHVSKQYRLGLVGTGSLQHDLNRWWHTIRGKEDPYLKVGEINDRSTKSTSDYVWALRDIDFEVEQGDVIGIIGKNGAGKSTLLKILSRVTAPTTGSIRAKGRIASLLEVGTGFHSELTGKENIFMNGSIMGMTKQEIKNKLDEIIDFAGIERYIDTPVKRYSSGMMVRLGFAVAAHLEPEILVVDEVLAVGDAEFQKKAIGKMKDVSQNSGRTVLFVSHNLEAVRRLCVKGILLKDGSIYKEGTIMEVLDTYVNEGNWATSAEYNKMVDHNLLLKSAYISNANGEVNTELLIGEKWNVDICFEVTEGSLERIIFAIGLCTAMDTPITTTWSLPQTLSKGLYRVRFTNKDVFLQKGSFKLVLGISKGVQSLFYDDSTLQFDVSLITKETNINLVKVDGTTGILMNQFDVEFFS